MNALSGIFKKKKKTEQQTPVISRKMLDERALRKSSEDTEDTSTEENKETRSLRAKVSSSARSSFVSSTSEDMFEMLEFRSVPDIMGYLEGIEGFLVNKLEVAEWLKDLRKYYANLIVYSKYCLIDIQRLEKVKFALKCKVEEVELINLDLKEQRDEFEMRLKAHEQVSYDCLTRIAEVRASREDKDPE